MLFVQTRHRKTSTLYFCCTPDSLYQQTKKVDLMHSGRRLEEIIYSVVDYRSD